MFPSLLWWIRSCECLAGGASTSFQSTSRLPQSTRGGWRTHPDGTKTRENSIELHAQSSQIKEARRPGWCWNSHRSCRRLSFVVHQPCIVPCRLVRVRSTTGPTGYHPIHPFFSFCPFALQRQTEPASCKSPHPPRPLLLARLLLLSDWQRTAERAPSLLHLPLTPRPSSSSSWPAAPWTRRR